MNPKPVVLRQAAVDDIRGAVSFYQDTASVETARRLIVALERAVDVVSAQPALGSPRFGHELDIPGLRSWRLEDFPYQVFYLETESSVQVWRVLHDRRHFALSIHPEAL